MALRPRSFALRALAAAARKHVEGEACDSEDPAAAAAASTAATAKTTAAVLALAHAATNECYPSKTCNVCAACCKAYITNGTSTSAR